MSVIPSPEKNGKRRVKSQRDPLQETLRSNRLKARLNAANSDQLQALVNNLELEIPEDSTPSTIRNILVEKGMNHLRVSEWLLTKSFPKRCKYDYICVVDFEATCIGRRNYGGFFPHEIIEFAAVMINVKKLKVVANFHSCVKPVIHPELSSFCKDLTELTQETVDNAPDFPEVLGDFLRWLRYHDKTEGSKIICTDGPRDIVHFLALTCMVHGLELPCCAREWVDIRNIYKRKYKYLKSLVSLPDLLFNVGLEFEGKQHSGQDDAKNIARLTILMLVDGVEIKPTHHFIVERYVVLKRRLLTYLEVNVPPDNPARSMLIQQLKEREQLSSIETAETLCPIDPELRGTEETLAGYKRKR